jgi:sulfoxide reductase heme-binding subunit YedZ
MTQKPLDLARKAKPLVFLLLLIPAGWMLYQALFAQGLLGPDPAKALVDQSGLWAIRTLLLALAITPLRIITQHSYLLIYRRMVGLYAFFYALMHFLIYTLLLLGADWARVGQELTQRPYIIVGLIALILYLPLAITSTHSWQRRLKRHWATLHKLVYLIGILAVIHMTWLKKIGLYDTWPYVLILLLAFLIRLWRRYHPQNTTKPI